MPNQPAPYPHPPGRRSLAYAALAFNRDNGFNGKIYSIGTACFYASFMLMMVGGPRQRGAMPCACEAGGCRPESHQGRSLSQRG